MLLNSKSIKNENKNKKECIFGLNSWDYTLLIILLFIFQSELPEMINIVFGFIIFFYLLFQSRSKAFLIILFILPSNEYINFGSTSLMSIFMFTNLIKSLLLGKFKISKSFFAFSLMFLIYSFISVAQLIYEPLIIAVKGICYLYFMSEVIGENRKKLKDLFNKAVLNLAMGLVISGLISILLSGFNVNGERFSFNSETTINLLGIQSGLSVIFLFYILLTTRRKSFIEYLLVLGCAFFGILTQSRTFILVIVIGIILYLITYSSFIKKIKLFSISAILTSITFFLFIYNNSLNTLAHELIDRLINPKDGDISNGRYYFWKLTINKMLDNDYYSWFGAGTYTELFNSLAHNMFLEVWVIYGIIGSLVCLGLYISFIKSNLLLKINKKLFKFKNSIHFVPIIVFLSSLVFSHHFVGRGMSLLFILCLFPIASICTQDKDSITFSKVS